MTPSAHPPIACNLSADEAAVQLLRWSDLGVQLIDSQRVPGGVRLRFPADHAEAVRELAAREAACCGFLTIEVTDRRDAVDLTITSSSPNAAQVIELLSGVPPSR